ncbi:MAG: diacylglycerol kinase family protein [Bacteroidota bacterium]|nr:diacylglycerol kinase family protein [Bacteroidota bacterium]
MRQYLKRRQRAFLFAFRGLRFFFGGDQHARIHLTLALIAILAAWFLKVDNWEWVAILLCIGGVISMEAMNAALETALDALHPEHREGIGRAKDIAAGAVLWASLISLLIGGLIFIPKILKLLQS